MQLREYDLIIVGAAGFTGRLVVDQIAQCDQLLRDASNRRRWAVSGRDRDRTAAALSGLDCDLPEIIEADLAEAASLPHLTERTNTIINLAGPFTPTAQNLIAACVSTQTSYVDLSGEIPLLKKVIDRFHDAAVEARIRIVQMAGWEALPADLTTLLASRRVLFNHDGPTVEANEEGSGCGLPINEVLVTASFARKPEGRLPLSQAVSAGTLSSIVEMLESRDAHLIGLPGTLLPPLQSSSNHFTSPLRLRPFNNDGRLIAPFSPVAFLNAPIVHRTAALRAAETSSTYRPARYLEGEDAGAASGRQVITRYGNAWVRTGLQRTIIGLAHSPAPVRRTISKALRKVVPEAGTGPTGRFQSDWEWSVHAKASTADGRTGEARLDGTGHPGYTATAAMVAEVGLRIALGRTPERFGCLTPALALGSLDLDPWFVDRLRLC